MLISLHQILYGIQVRVYIFFCDETNHKMAIVKVKCTKIWVHKLQASSQSLSFVSVKRESYLPHQKYEKNIPNVTKVVKVVFTLSSLIQAYLERSRRPRPKFVEELRISNRSYQVSGKG